MLITGLLFCLTASTIPATGQEHSQNERATSQGAVKGPQIEVKTDRFTKVTTVTLKPLKIVDKADVFLTMEIETKLGQKGQDKEVVIAFVKLELQSKDPLFPDIKELNFLVDDQPLSAGKAKFDLDRLTDINGELKPGFKFREFANSLAFDRPALEQISKANRIEMQLGPIETTFSNTLVASLREYAVQVLAQHKIAKEKQP
jgi:hypothetical protein